MPALTEAQVAEIVASTFGKFKEEILSTMRPQVCKVFALGSQVQPQSSFENSVPRSNIWCGKCHGYGHLATKCPTPSKLVPNESCTLFCTYCLKSNHTEDCCFVKQAHERQKSQGLHTNFNFMDWNNIAFAIGVVSGYMSNLGKKNWKQVVEGIMKQ